MTENITEQLNKLTIEQHKLLLLQTALADERIIAVLMVNMCRLEKLQQFVYALDELTRACNATANKANISLSELITNNTNNLNNILYLYEQIKQITPATTH